MSLASVAFRGQPGASTGQRQIANSVRPDQRSVWPPGPPTETSGTTEPSTGTLPAADPVTARPLAVAEPNTGAGEWRLCARETCHQPFHAVVGVRGRPRLYCSRSCTRAASNLRRTVERRGEESMRFRDFAQVLQETVLAAVRSRDEAMQQALALVLAAVTGRSAEGLQLDVTRLWAGLPPLPTRVDLEVDRDQRAEPGSGDLGGYLPPDVSLIDEFDGTDDAEPSPRPSDSAVRAGLVVDPATGGGSGCGDKGEKGVDTPVTTAPYPAAATAIKDRSDVTSTTTSVTGWIPRVVRDPAEHPIYRAAWEWASADTCPTSWWRDHAKPTTAPTAAQLLAEYRHPTLTPLIDAAFAGITQELTGAGITRRAVKRFTHRDRRSLLEYLISPPPGATPTDVVAAIRWAAADNRPWNSTGMSWQQKIIDDGIPRHQKTFTSIVAQWVGADRPDRTVVDDTMTTTADDIAATWGQLIGHTGTPPAGWRTAATALLVGTDRTPPFTPTEVGELMKWIRRPEQARFYRGDIFPTPDVLARAKGQRRAAPSGRQGQVTVPKRADYNPDTAAAFGWSKADQKMNPWDQT